MILIGDLALASCMRRESTKVFSAALEAQYAGSPAAGMTAM